MYVHSLNCASNSFLEESTRPESAFTNFNQNIPHGCATTVLNTAPKVGLVGPVNLLSSSEASLQELTRKFGNTGQRQKSLSGHSKIAEVTNSSGEKLVTMLEKLNEKDSKLQWDMFQEQLRYNRERDLITQENARLTHANPGNLVQAIAGLTQVLSTTLQSSSFPVRSYNPTHPPYGPINPPHYGLTTNCEAPPPYTTIATYGVHQQQPYHREPSCGPLSLYPPVWAKSSTIDASNDETACPENLLSANKHDP